MSMGVSYRPKFATRPFRPNDHLTAIYMRAIPASIYRTTRTAAYVLWSASSTSRVLNAAITGRKGWCDDVLRFNVCLKADSSKN